MSLSVEALALRNKKIKESGKATRKRRKTQVCRAFTCKVDYRKLKSEQRKTLSELFRDAKHLYNDCVTSDSVFTYVPSREVTVRMKDGSTEPRTLDRIGAQMMQGVVQQTKDNMRALAALKKKGYEVGALKPVKSFDSIPLKQPGRTYRLRGNYIRINRIPGLMRLTGMKQLDGWEIGPAKLLRKASGYYVAFSCFKDKTAYEKEQPYTPAPVNPIGGVDAGLKDEIVESDGTKTTRRYPDSRKARYWARRMGKRDKSSRGWWKANRAYRMEHERLAARRKHAAIEEPQRLTRKYATLVIQNEQSAHGTRTRDTRGAVGRSMRASSDASTPTSSNSGTSSSWTNGSPPPPGAVTAAGAHPAPPTYAPTPAPTAVSGRTVTSMPH